jgi:predicted nucleotidyltransferase
MESALAALPEIIRRTVEVSDPEKIILFGSYARGDFGPDSDLDLLVVKSGVDKPRAEADKIRTALRGVRVPIDIVVVDADILDQYKSNIGLIYSTVLAEGRTLYERSLAL